MFDSFDERDRRKDEKTLADIEEDGPRIIIHQKDSFPERLRGGLLSL